MKIVASQFLQRDATIISSNGNEVIAFWMRNIIHNVSKDFQKSGLSLPFSIHKMIHFFYFFNRQTFCVQNKKWILEREMWSFEVKKTEKIYHYNVYIKVTLGIFLHFILSFINKSNKTNILMEGCTKIHAKCRISWFFGNNCPCFLKDFCKTTNIIFHENQRKCWI